jgi:cytochrome c biogenesis protein
MSEAVSSPGIRPRSTLTGSLLEFLGSMNLAITLLVAVAIASVIGMVVPQNQPYTDYVLQFGPFWFKVFHTLGLYDVYSVGWFVAILAFLVLSTSVCVVRNGPGMLRDMTQFRLTVQAKSLRLMREHVERETSVDIGAVQARAERLLSNHGYRVRRSDADGVRTMAAMKGASNRLGYLLTHVGLVVILLSGVIDGNLPMQIDMALHGTRVETHDIPVSKVPADSWLGPGTLAFRGDVNIPVGDTTDVLFINWGKGYLVQQLPFTLTLKKFTVERFESGPPKDFISKVVVHDPATGQTVKAQVSDNHPLMFHGYDIYQTSFGDGGSLLHFRVWPFDGGGARRMSGHVFDHYSIATAQGERTLELNNFHRYNVINADFGRPGHARDRGPSMTFKVRKPDGVAMEYINYLEPQVVHGQPYYLSGVRSSPALNYRYLRIPAGPNGGVRHFMQLASALHDAAARRRAVAAVEANAEQLFAGESPAFGQRFSGALGGLLKEFAGGGYTAVFERIRKQVPKAHQATVAAVSVQVINLALAQLYNQVLIRDGASGFTSKDQKWLKAAVPALGVLPEYGAPFYLQLTGFHQIQSSGLQITHYPATPAAFIGSAMLMVGILLMFFVAHRRLWLRLEPRGDGGTRILFAGASNRDRLAFARQFAQLQDKLFARLRDD